MESCFSILDKTILFSINIWYNLVETIKVNLAKTNGKSTVGNESDSILQFGEFSIQTDTRLVMAGEKTIHHTGNGFRI